MSRNRSFHEIFPATATLLVVNLAFFAIEFIGHGKVNEQAPGFGSITGVVLLKLGMLRGFEVEQLGEYWRLVSGNYLHGNLLHLGMNMWALYIVGSFCEPKLSPWRYFTVYTVCGICGSFASLRFSGGGGSVGASGAIAGLIGFTAAFAIKYDDLAIKAWIFRPIGYMVLLSFLSPANIDHAGHAGGFVAGAIFGVLTEEYTTSASAAWWKIPGCLTAVVVAVCLVRALLYWFVPGLTFG